MTVNKREAILINFVKNEAQLAKKDGKVIDVVKSTKKLNQLTENLYDYKIYEISDAEFHYVRYE